MASIPDLSSFLWPSCSALLTFVVLTYSKYQVIKTYIVLKFFVLLQHQNSTTMDWIIGAIIAYVLIKSTAKYFPSDRFVDRE